MTDYSDLSPANADPVIVEWADIVNLANWNEDAEVDFVTVRTTGWLLEDSSTRLVVASSYNYEDERWADIHIFPKYPPAVVARLVPEASAETPEPDEG